MSGAFNIDIEVGPSNSGGKIRIYCASLTDTWNVDHAGNELKQFHHALSNAPEIKKNKIGLGQCPPIDNIGECELFLSRLGCTSSILRIKLFHQFLNIPKSVRDGLTYASHKPFGKSVREGYMQKHPRFVRRGGGKKWIRLTKDARGGSLICYKDENKTTTISSMKIGASTEIQNLQNKGIPNAFVLKSGKRQWVLQTANPRDYQVWQTALDNMLQEFGKKISTASPKNPSGGSGGKDEKKEQYKGGGTGRVINIVSDNSNVSKLESINKDLKSKVFNLTEQVEGMEKELRKLKSKHDEFSSDKNSIQKKIDADFAKESDGLIRDYEIQMENLRNELQEIGRAIVAKAPMDNGKKSGFGRLTSGFGGLGTEEDYAAEIDLEKKILDGFTEDERQTISFLHKHFHRHTHRHVHVHRHIHLHKDEEENDETVDVEDLELIDKHTVAQSITHSMTQIRIEGKFY